MPDSDDHTRPPVNLEDALRYGALFLGAEMARMVLFSPDGKKYVFPLPSAKRAQDDGLTDSQRAILKALRESPAPLTRKAVALRVGAKVSTGRFGQSFPLLLERGLIYVRDGVYADDEAKFQR